MGVVLRVLRPQRDRGADVSIPAALLDMPADAVGFAVVIGGEVPYRSEGPNTAECRDALLTALGERLKEMGEAPDEVWGHYPPRGWRMLLQRRVPEPPTDDFGEHPFGDPDDDRSPPGVAWAEGVICHFCGSDRVADVSEDSRECKDCDRYWRWPNPDTAPIR